jgi:hypothetical protein
MSESIAAPVLWLDRSGAGESRWEDCVPGRTDLPRRLPELPVLGITPLDAGAPAPSGEGFLYRRTPRSGQGRLTGRPTTGLVLVLISPKRADGAQALRDWGDFVHIAEIAAAAVPGYTMITPYEIDGEGPRFLHLYELEGDDPEAMFQSMTPLVRARLDDDAYKAWAWHPELCIDYVSTYRRAP